MNSILEAKDWEPLIDLLREEVQEYGGLFNLLERQQSEIFLKDAELVMKTNGEIEAYMLEMGGLRESREAKVREMAGMCGCDSELSLSNMLEHFPEYIRPLLKALVDEINHMVRQTRRKAQQNFLLLSRTMELTHETIRALQPDNYSKTYTRKGRVEVGARMPSRYKAFV